MNDYILIVYIVVISCITLGVLAFLLSLLHEGYKRICVKMLEYKRYFSEKGVFEGEEVYLIEEVTNKSFFPMFRIRIESFVTSKIELAGYEGIRGDNQQFVSPFFIMPYTKIKRRHKAVCTKRGCYVLESAKVDFSGLDLYVDSRAKLCVYPRELEPEMIESINNYLQYGARSVMPVLRDIFEYSGIREYSHGDATNTINHKATARYGKLMVNNHDYIMGRRLLMYINFQMPQDRYQDIDEFNELMEKAMSYVSYMASWSAQNGYLFSVRANCKTHSGNNCIRFAYGTGITEYEELLEELAMSRNIYGVSITSLMDMDIQNEDDRTEVYIFTTYIDESIEKRISLFEQSGNMVSVAMLQ